MTLQSVFEQYKHLDNLLSDREWLFRPDEDGHVDALMLILYDCWEAIKEELNLENSNSKKYLCENLTEALKHLNNPYLGITKGICEFAGHPRNEEDERNRCFCREKVYPAKEGFR